MNESKPSQEFNQETTQPISNQEYVPTEFQQNRSVVSIGDWVVTFLILIIPFVNIVMLFIWAFSKSTPASKANWAKTALIFLGASAIITALFWGSIFGAFIAASL